MQPMDYIGYKSHYFQLLLFFYKPKDFLLHLLMDMAIKIELQ